MLIIHDRFDVSKSYRYRLKLFSNGDIEIRHYSSDLVNKDPDFVSWDDPAPPAVILGDSAPAKDEPAADVFQECRRDNLHRSRVICSDLAHENVKLWHSFITLTFAENVTDLSEANKKFANFIRSWSRVKPDFAYLAVPEFQIRGAVHYHLLSNLECNVDIKKEKPLFTASDKTGRDYKGQKVLEYYNIKFWNQGFSSAFPLELADDKFKVYLYITKYLLKDIDNRLFGRHKIMHSQNLAMPNVSKFSEGDDKLSQVLDILDKYNVETFSFFPSEAFQVSFDEKKITLSEFDYLCIKNYLHK